VKKFRDLLLPAEECPNCLFRFGREPGYYFGVLTPILPLISLGLGAFCAAIAYLAASRDLLTVLVAGGLGTALGLPLFFRPSIAFYVALDHSIDPPPKSGAN
jgi:hypothetical protein